MLTPLFAKLKQEKKEWIKGKTREMPSDSMYEVTNE
jgi:hypothetical protein